MECYTTIRTWLMGMYRNLMAPDDFRNLGLTFEDKERDNGAGSSGGENVKS